MVSRERLRRLLLRFALELPVVVDLEPEHVQRALHYLHAMEVLRHKQGDE